MAVVQLDEKHDGDSYECELGALAAARATAAGAGRAGCCRAVCRLAFRHLRRGAPFGTSRRSVLALRS